MSEKRFKTLTIIIEEDTGTVQTHIRSELSAPQLMDKIFELSKENKQLKSYKLYDDNKRLQTIVADLKKQNEDLREVNKENQLLHEENVKQCERWKKLYEIKDAEVTARVDGLNKICNYYLNEVLFKSDVDPNKAVKEVLTEILNTEVEM